MSNPVSFFSSRLFTLLPDDASFEIFDYLTGSSVDEKAALSTVRVCKDWRENLLVQVVHNEMSVRLQQRAHLVHVHNELIVKRFYPSAMIQFFQDRGVSLDRVPVLDVGERLRGSGYVDMLSPADMAQPIMRFIDPANRPGIAFHLEGYAEGLANLGPDGQIPIRAISGVLAIFQYDALLAGVWKVGMAAGLLCAMHKVHTDRHEEDGHVGDRFTLCPTCPTGMRSGDKASYTTLSNFLTAKDPLFRIAQGYLPH